MDTSGGAFVVSGGYEGRSWVTSGRKRRVDSVVMTCTDPTSGPEIGRRTALARIAMYGVCSAATAVGPLMLDSVMPQYADATESPQMCSKSFYELSAKKDGTRISLADYDGKVSLVVNVASMCALTTQYEGLAELDRNFRSKGLRVLAFPCNQFGRQEPGTEEEICAFARENYGAKFTIFDKIEVNGPGTDEVYQFLKNNNPDDSKRIEWNFAKFLVDRSGCVVRRYKPGTQPHSLERDVVALLEARPLPMKRKAKLGVE